MTHTVISALAYGILVSALALFALHIVAVTHRIWVALDHIAKTLDRQLSGDRYDI